MASRVENRRSSCSLPVAALTWLSPRPPQSGLAWLCFLFPLIEPDRRISRIRLSEKTHAFAHGRLAVRFAKSDQTTYLMQGCFRRNRLIAGHVSLCLAHSH